MKDRNFYSRERSDNKVNYNMKLLEYKSELIHDLNKCTGCGICTIVCPKEAIERTDSDEKVIIPDIEKCSFCGICDYFCPFDAWELLINGEHKLILKETEGNLPDLLGEELECPENNKPVQKYLDGIIEIYPEKCPEGCKKCVDACMMNVIDFTSLDKNREVILNEDQCIYCTACSVVCPEPEALEVSRIGIKFEADQIKSSSIFNEILRKLISQKVLAKVLKEKSLELARNATLKLLREEE
ncbi:MAG: 4Fe-4S dicluster domain-containing protein [Candidatus Lokiarchaeota archaeon]|nr:4Fe-4S dicluster domain-containing protein [Candidatus Lokiarchaeota archaeon]